MKSFKGFGIFAAACYLAIFHSTTASAHPGHGVDVDGNSVAHYFASPTHAVSFMLIAAGIAAVCFAGVYRSRRAGQLATNQ